VVMVVSLGGRLSKAVASARLAAELETCLETGQRAFTFRLDMAHRSRHHCQVGAPAKARQQHQAPPRRLHSANLPTPIGVHLSR
jgi:hypothetical protein